MAKKLKDILAGVKSSKIVPGSTGKDPGVDYKPKAPNEQDFVDLHKTEKHADRVGNGSDVYQATNVRHSQEKERHGYKKPEDKAVNEAREEAKCNMTNEGTYCPVHENADCYKQKTLKEILTKKTPAGEVIKDFQKSKDPKFAGKSKEERKRMALGAYYGMHPEKSKKTNEEVDLDEGAIKDAEAALERHAQKKIAKEKEYGPMSGADLRSHELERKRLLSLKTKAQRNYRKNVGEEIEQVDEVSKDTLQRYMHAAKPERMDPVKGKQRRAGMDLALLKSLGSKKVKVKAAGQSRKEMGEETEGFNSGVSNGTDSAEHVHEDVGSIRKEYNDLKKHDIKTLRDMVGRQSKISDTKELKSKDHAISTYLRNKHGHKKVDAAFNEDLAVPLLGGDDESAEMAKTQLRALANKALHLAMQLNDDQVVEPWVQAKIAVAKDNVTAVHDYMIYGDHSKGKEEDEQTAPYDGGIDMTGAPRNTYPDFSVDVNTGRNV